MVGSLPHFTSAFASTCAPEGTRVFFLFSSFLYIFTARVDVAPRDVASLCRGFLQKNSVRIDSCFAIFYDLISIFEADLIIVSTLFLGAANTTGE